MRDSRTADGRRPATDRVLDLRGVACPLTFARTVLALEELSAGAVIAVLLDPGEAAESVPRSVTLNGDHVLATEPVAGHVRVRIRKA